MFSIAGTLISASAAPHYGFKGRKKKKKKKKKKTREEEVWEGKERKRKQKKKKKKGSTVPEFQVLAPFTGLVSHRR